MKARKKNRDWTLIVIADNGPIGSFHIKRSLFRVLIIILLGFVSIASVYFYFYNADIIMVREELERKIERTEQSLSFAVGINSDLTRKISELEKSLVAALDEDISGEGVSPVAESGLSAVNIAIENFEVKRDLPDSTIRFKFLLRNTSPSESYISGFVFALYRPDFLDSASWKVFPGAALTGGMPEDITAGDPFNIARFKAVRGHFTDVRPAGSFFVSVWVFSSEGNLIFFKDYFVEK